MGEFSSAINRFSEFCGHGNSRVSCSSCRSENRERVDSEIADLGSRLENMVLFDRDGSGQTVRSADLRRQEIDRSVEALRKKREECGKGREGGMPEFFEAISRHEEADLKYGMSLNFLQKEANNLFGRDVANLTREEVKLIRLGFPGEVELEKEESTVVDHYRKSESEWWSTIRLNVTDGQVLKNGLEYRMAERIADKTERDQALDDLDAEMVRIARSVPALADSANEENASMKSRGKQAECQTMVLVRHWVREVGLDHVVGIEHTLPKDDHKHGIDFVFRVGANLYHIDQKAISFDGYTSESRDRLVDTAEKKSALVGGNVLQLDVVELRQAFADYVDGKPERRRGSILERLADLLKPEDRELVLGMVGRKRERAPESVATPKELGNAFTVGLMMKHGLLAKDEMRDMNRINAIREEAIRMAKKAGITSENVGSLEGRAAVADRFLSEIHSRKGVA